MILVFAFMIPKKTNTNCIEQFDEWRAYFDKIHAERSGLHFSLENGDENKHENKNENQATIENWQSANNANAKINNENDEDDDKLTDHIKMLAIKMKEKLERELLKEKRRNMATTIFVKLFDPPKSQISKLKCVIESFARTRDTIKIIAKAFISNSTPQDIILTIENYYLQKIINADDFEIEKLKFKNMIIHECKEMIITAFKKLTQDELDPMNNNDCEVVRQYFEKFLCCYTADLLVGEQEFDKKIKNILKNDESIDVKINMLKKIIL